MFYKVSKCIQFKEFLAEPPQMTWDIGFQIEVKEDDFFKECLQMNTKNL